MKKTSEAVQLYTLILRREVPVTAAFTGEPTGEVKHLTERHAGCTYEQALELRKKATHVADAMIEPLRKGVPGTIESSVDIGRAVNMHPAGPRKPREASPEPRRYEASKPAQAPRRAREMPLAPTSAPSLADLVNTMGGELA